MVKHTAHNGTNIGSTPIRFTTLKKKLNSMSFLKFLETFFLFLVFLWVSFLASVVVYGSIIVITYRTLKYYLFTGPRTEFMTRLFELEDRVGDLEGVTGTVATTIIERAPEVVGYSYTTQALWFAGLVLVFISFSNPYMGPPIMSSAMVVYGAPGTRRTPNFIDRLLEYGFIPPQTYAQNKDAVDGMSMIFDVLEWIYA